MRFVARGGTLGLPWVQPLYAFRNGLQSIHTTAKTYIVASLARGKMRSRYVPVTPPSSRRVMLFDNGVRSGWRDKKICVLSADDVIATDLSKLSSTSFRMSCERASIDDFRRVIPTASSWYVASECMRAKNVLGWNVLDVIRRQWNSVSVNDPLCYKL